MGGRWESRNGSPWRGALHQSRWRSMMFSTVHLGNTSKTADFAWTGGVGCCLGCCWREFFLGNAEAMVMFALIGGRLEEVIWFDYMMYIKCIMRSSWYLECFFLIGVPLVLIWKLTLHFQWHKVGGAAMSQRLFISMTSGQSSMVGKGHDAPCKGHGLSSR